MRLETQEGRTNAPYPCISDPSDVSYVTNIDSCIRSRFVRADVACCQRIEIKGLIARVLINQLEVGCQTYKICFAISTGVAYDEDSPRRAGG